jgi:hypothetical protein
MSGSLRPLLDDESGALTVTSQEDADCMIGEGPCVAHLNSETPHILLQVDATLEVANFTVREKSGKFKYICE